MGKCYSRVQRGMVFWFNPDKVYQQPGSFTAYNGHLMCSHIQRGNRPYVVVSNNEGNSSGYTCNVVPITTAEKTKIPSHVEFTLPCSPKTPQTALVEQIRTVDSQALGDFICILSEAVMHDIDAALMAQFGIAFETVDLDGVMSRLETIVSHIIESKMNELKLRTQRVPCEIIEDAALRLGGTLEGLFNSQVDTLEIPTEEPAQILLNDEESPQPMVEKPSGRKISKAKETTRIEWTVKRCKKFLADCEKYTMDELKERWGLPSNKSAYQAKYMCRKKLGKVEKKKKKNEK